jgi:hypothetical protein
LVLCLLFNWLHSKAFLVFLIDLIPKTMTMGNQQR